ncbi:MAG: UDP-N-acetylmuramoyl-L-alanyl-D-glutamate--2,6-diaminopimelate ligase [Anaerovorax sp.]
MMIYNLAQYKKLFEKKGLVCETNFQEQDEQVPVCYISYDSQDIRDNTLFVCKGAHFSVDYLKDALQKGAIGYISERPYSLDEEVPFIIVSDMRKAMAYLADFFYDQVWKGLCLIGITGTKGKSTTAYFMKHILDEYLNAQKKPVSGILSGIDNYDGVIKEESHLTTPEAMMLHKHFDNCVKSDMEFLTMEVSSQALKYHRTLGITYDIGCYLNIGEDHISDVEHADFEDYFQSKLKLFTQCNMACINICAEKSQEVVALAKERCKKVVTFGLDEGADVYGYDIVKSGKNITFKVRTDSFDREFKLSIAGLFNVENALAAIAMCYCLNISMEYVYAGLKKAKVSGRMEVYSSETKDLQVIVDYAHNKMSFETLFKSTQREYPGKKITIVFGCPGKKALGRRKELGELAGKYANMVYITEEDAGEESVLKISKEIAKYVEQQNCPCLIIEDREEAIKDAILTADENTIVLITGKGRETRQKRGTNYIDCPSDVEYVKRYL